MIVLKDGTIIGEGNRSAYFFIKNKDTDDYIIRFPTYNKCKDELRIMENSEDYEIVFDWVLVRG